MVKIFKLSDYEWFAAETLDDAIACAKQEFGFRDSDFDDFEPYELGDEELDQMQYQFTDDANRPTVCLSFREALVKMIADGDEFPYIFAATEG